MESLVDYLTETFRREIEKSLREEQDNDKLFSQEAFKTCKGRAKAILEPSVTEVENILTLATITHREKPIECKGHGESYENERKVMEIQVSIEDQRIIKTSSRKGAFWKS